MVVWLMITGAGNVNQVIGNQVPAFTGFGHEYHLW